jgi:hypothetical protein
VVCSGKIGIKITDKETSVLIACSFPQISGGVKYIACHGNRKQKERGEKNTF